MSSISPEETCPENSLYQEREPYKWVVSQFLSILIYHDPFPVPSFIPVTSDHPNLVIWSTLRCHEIDATRMNEMMGPRAVVPPGLQAERTVHRVRLVLIIQTEGRLMVRVRVMIHLCIAILSGR